MRVLVHCMLGSCVGEGLVDCMLGNTIGGGFGALYVRKLFR